MLAGLPTTATRTSSAARLLSAWPWPTKIGPLTLISSPRSMPFDRGREPISSAQLTPSKATSGSSVATMLSSNGKAQSSSSMTTPSSDGRAGVISSRCRATRVSGPKTSPEASAGQNGVADLAGGAGDSNFNEFGHSGFSLDKNAWNVPGRCGTVNRGPRPSSGALRSASDRTTPWYYHRLTQTGNVQISPGFCRYPRALSWRKHVAYGRTGQST